MTGRLDLARYQAVLRLPRAPTLLSAGLLGQMPVGMVSLALVLATVEASGSYLLAGFAVATHSLGTGLSALWGRGADRFGLRPVLILTAFGFMTALAVVIVLFAEDGPPSAILLSAFVAGVTRPVVSGVVRSQWPRLTRDTSVLQSAYVLQSIQLEVVWLLGPLAVAALVISLGPSLGPSAALAVAGVLGALGAILVAAAAFEDSTKLRRRDHPGDAPRLYTRRFLLILTCAGLFDLAAGAAILAITAVAERAGAPSLSGLLIAVWMGGSIMGGLWYGAWRVSRALSGQYRRLLLGIGAAYGVMALAWSPWLLAACLLVSGMMLAPTIAVLYGLIAQAAPANARTEGFTWLETVAAGGGAAGAALGGAVIYALDSTSAAFLVAAGSMLAAAFLAGRRALVSTPA